MMKTFSLKQLSLVLFFGILGFNSNSQVVINIKPGPEDGKDAYVNSYYERILDSTHSFIAAAWTYGGVEGVGRSFIQFELPELPLTYSNFKAELNLYYNYCSAHVGHGGDNACKLERIIQDWTETGVAWYHQPEVTSENAVLLPASLTENQDYPNIDVTQLVLDMYANPETSFGFRLSLIEETIYRSMILASSDHFDENIRPSLVISYDTCSIEKDFTYQSDEMMFSFEYTQPDCSYIRWDFGNGYGSSLQNPVYFFNEPGTYNVCLVAANSCDTIEICKEITVCEDLIPNFSYQIDSLNVNFTNLTNNGTEFYWDFGNGFFSYLENPEFQYEFPGTYYICLMVSNQCETQSICDTIVILQNENGQEGTLILEEKGDLNSLINIYPNPSKDYLFINSKEINIYSCEIFNSQGVLIHNFNINSIPYKYNLSLQNIGSGFYFIKFDTDKGAITKRLIVL